MAGPGDNTKIKPKGGGEADALKRSICGLHARDRRRS